jgi:hypothetical protein
LVLTYKGWGRRRPYLCVMGASARSSVGMLSGSTKQKRAISDISFVESFAYVKFREFPNIRE